MRIVVALGGNALLRRRETPEAEIQEAHVRAAVAALAPLARDHQLVVTHGNGPQVGVLASESARDPELSHPYPLDVVGSQTQGMIGYWLLQALENSLPGRDVVCLVSQVVVAADDRAFREPSKFVGPLYEEATVRRLAKERAWTVRQDEGGWRRVVASPEPRELVEMGMVRRCLEGGAVVVCAGGGGVPVVRRRNGALSGVEAVVDKDLTAALLATELGAEILLILTDVPAVELNHASARAQPIRRTTVGALRAHRFPPGSMGPKVEAACRFVSGTGGVAAIGCLDDAATLVQGRSGTQVVPG